MRAVERVTADPSLHTPDLGGKATTRQVTDAVSEAIQGDNILGAGAMPMVQRARTPAIAVRGRDRGGGSRPNACLRTCRRRRRDARIVIGAGKAAASMARAVEARLAGRPVGPCRHPVRPCRADIPHPGPRGGTSGAGRRGRRGIPGDHEPGLRSHARRPRAVPDLGRRLRAPGAADRRPDARGQAGGQQGAPALWRDHRRDELRPPAPVGDQGRAARRGVPSREGRHAADLRRSRRRPDQHRLRPDGAGSHHLRRRARDPGALWDQACPAVLDVLDSGRGETIKPGDQRLAEADVG